MPKANGVNVIASAPKLLGRVLIGVVVFGVVFFISHRQAVNRPTNCPLKLAQGCVQLRYATTPGQQAQGLSGTDPLPDNQGMLFIFDKPSKPCMWMKDTKYSLDIIWVSPDKNINKIVPSLAPSSYPAQFCATTDTKYVLEMAAGEAARNNLSVDQGLDLSLK